MPASGNAPRYFKARISKGGPLCGLKIWRGFGDDPDTGETLERAWIWRAAINGTDVQIEDVAPHIADGTGDSVRGVEINETEYLYFCKAAAWAKRHAPNDPAANPRKPVNMNLMDPIKF